MKTINLENITTSEAREVIDQVAAQLVNDNVEQLISADHLAVIDYALTNNLQLRDYLMGLPSHYELDDCERVIKTLCDLFAANELKTYQLKTIYAGYKLERGDNAAALELLSEALAAKYPLAQLLNRVILAGWPSGELAIMRAQLHPQVCAELDRTSGDLANELAR